MNFRRISLTLLLCIALVSMLGAQVARQSGVIRGTVTDNEGNPLPGMTITGTSPSQLGTVSDITNDRGRIPADQPVPGNLHPDGRDAGIQDPEEGRHHRPGRTDHHDQPSDRTLVHQ